jgi:cytochrome c-type biogenesis protein CcmH
MSARAVRISWAVLGAVVVVVLVVALWPRGDESVASHTRRIAAEFRCVDCEGLSVADSNTASAREQRRDIAARIRRGESDGEIRRAYVDTYGESILLKPSGDGIGVLVWGLPILALGLGGIGLWLTIRRWQRQPRLTATAADDAVVAEHRGDVGGD